MNILKKLFGQERPTLKKDDIPNFTKVAEFIIWYIKNEPIAKTLNNPSNHIIFNEGCRPIVEIKNNPDLTDSKINSIIKWFAVKFFTDINISWFPAFNATALID